MKDVHPCANIWPDMSPTEFDQLCESVKQDGLEHAIVLDSEDRIVDGRHRERACLKVGVEPRYVTNYDLDGPDGKVDDLKALRYSLRVHIKRNLTQEQQFDVYEKAYEMERELAPRREMAGKGADGSGGRGKKKTLGADAPRVSPESGKAISRAAAAANLSPATARRYQRVRDKKVVPELIHAIKKGRLPVNTALRLADLPAEEHTTVATAPEPKVEAAKHLNGHAKKVTKPRVKAVGKPAKELKTRWKELLNEAKWVMQTLTQYSPVIWGKQQQVDFVQKVINLSVASLESRDE